MSARILALMSIGALVCVLLSRSLGPSDLWDQEQPRTVSYTTDIISHGGWHWVLPIERGVKPATKPPMYNWIAAPFVKWLGFSNELAHKMPSVMALCACWLIVVRLGRRIDPNPDGSVGWLAGLLLVSNYTIFKLGYLARPDMLLTLWLLVAWWSATQVILTRSAAMAWVFWVSFTLSSLTKGPAALVALTFAVVASRLIGGSWRTVNAFRWWIGAPISIAAVGLWVYGAWHIDPDHVKNVLWYNEFFGRVTGLGPEGSSEGPSSWLSGLPIQFAYFFVRFAPWSICTIAAIVVLWLEARRPSRWRARAEIVGSTVPVPEGRTELSQSTLGTLAATDSAWLRSAAIQVIVVIVLFTLSTGKRADYLAAAFVAGSLLASWWLLRVPPRLAWRLPWLAPALATAGLVVMTTVNVRQPAAPSAEFSNGIDDFIRQASQAIADNPAPVEFCWTGESHLQAMLGYSTLDRNDKEDVLAILQHEQPFWVIAGRKTSEPHDLEQWLVQRRRPGIATVVVRSPVLPRAQGWPEQVTLFRVEP